MSPTNGEQLVTRKFIYSDENKKKQRALHIIINTP